MTNDLLKPVCALLVYHDTNDEVMLFAIPFGAREFEVIEKARLAAGKILNSDKMTPEQEESIIYIDELIYKNGLKNFEVNQNEPLTTKMITEVVTCGWAP